MKVGKPAWMHFTDLQKRAEGGEFQEYHYKMLVGGRVLYESGFSTTQTNELLNRASNTVGRRQPKPKEIANVIKLIFDEDEPTSLKDFQKPSRAVKISPALIQEMAAKGSIDKLRQKSGPIPNDPAVILEKLFPDPSTLLHLSPTIFEGQVKPRSEWTGLDKMQFMCSCAFADPDGGRVLKNVLSQPYIVFETDRPELAGDWDAQAGILEYLSTLLPLRMITWSANVSLHAMFDARTPLKDKLQNFSDTCVRLGADSMSLRASQLTRFPWGQRADNGKTQKVLYFNDQ